MAAGLIAPVTIARTAPLTRMMLGFNGTSSYLTAPQLLIGQPLAQFSFETWVNLADAAKSGTLWSNNDGSLSLQFLGGTPAAKLQIVMGTTTLTFGYSFSAGEWYYIVVSYDTTGDQTIGLWVNAAPQVPLTHDLSPLSLGPARIGAAGGSASLFLDGAIGMVRFWKGIVYGQNVAELQYMTLWGPTTMTGAFGEMVLIGNWHCDEGYGDIAFDYSGDADASLGGGNPLAKPRWEVSTILKPPDFITLETLTTPGPGPEQLKIRMAFPPRAALEIPAATPRMQQHTAKKEQVEATRKRAPSKKKR